MIDQRILGAQLGHNRLDEGDVEGGEIVGELRGPLETQLLKGRSVSCLVFPSVALRCLARIEDDAAFPRMSARCEST